MAIEQAAGSDVDELWRINWRKCRLLLPKARQGTDTGEGGERRDERRCERPSGGFSTRCIASCLSHLHSVRYRTATGVGAITCFIRSSFQSPATLKCAVAPSSAASIKLWLT